MSNADRGRLRGTKHRALALLMGIELFGPECDAPSFPVVTAAALREVARLCVTECYHLDLLKEEMR